MAKQSKPKKAKGKKTGRKTGKLVPQQHGGALLDGAASPETHVPGPGRPPSVVKQALRQKFDERIPTLAEIADGTVDIRIREKCPECGYKGKILDDEDFLIEMETAFASSPSTTDRIRAIEAMAKFSDLKDEGPDEGLVAELGTAIAEVIEDPELLDRIAERWKRIIGRRIVLGS